MKFIKLDIINNDNFIVLDEDNNTITGLETSDFTFGLYNPSGVESSSTIPVTITELENGLYRVSFTPNVAGNWLLVVYHSVYFSYGKLNDYECVNSLWDDVQLILGLVQQNFRIANTVYDVNNLLTSATIKIFNNASDCTDDVNPIATYSMVAVFNSESEMTSYKMVKN